MTLPLTFQKVNLVELGTTELTDHTRGPLGIEYEEIRVENRLAGGKMRRYSVGYKRRFSLSWEYLPGPDAATVDGKAGRDTLQALVVANTSTLTFNYRDANDDDVSFTVFIDSYSEELLKRYDNQLWAVTLSLVEQ